MKTTLIAKYERESTLWKNANGFYHAQNWTLMECLYIDYSDDRELIETDGIRFIDNRGNDITDKIIEEKYTDTYTIKFTNARHTNSKCYDFKTKRRSKCILSPNHER